MFPEDKYKVAFEKDGIKAYVPINPADYHVSRYVELNNQLIYASSGTTKDILSATIEQILTIVNADKPIATTRSDIAVLCNNIKYRLRNPVDELASLRAGATVCFLEGENPDECTGFWLDKKMELTKQPDWYSFFLTLGIMQQPKSEEFLDISKREAYFRERATMLASLEPSKAG